MPHGRLIRTAAAGDAAEAAGTGRPTAARAAADRRMGRRIRAAAISPHGPPQGRRTGRRGRVRAFRTGSPAMIPPPFPAAPPRARRNPSTPGLMIGNYGTPVVRRWKPVDPGSARPGLEHRRLK